MPGGMIATQAESGERLWSINVPGTQAPSVAGGSVFVVDTQGQLMALSRSDGKTQWTTKLPGTGAWAGPTLAGGTLWLASSAGTLVGVDAATGKIGGAEGSRQRRLRRPRGRAGAHVRADRQRQAYRA